MKQRKYFDCVGSVGRKSVPDIDYPYDLSTLLADMEYARVHAAAVVHNAAKDYSYQYGNQLGLKLSQENNRLHCLAAVTPAATFETGNCNYFNDLLNDGASGFVLLEQSIIRDSVDAKSMHRIADALLSHGRPLIIPCSSIPERYAMVGKLAEEYSSLPLIMQGSHWGTNRLLLDIMGRYDNTYFDIVTNHGNDILEYTSEYFGIERVLYSTDWPLHSMGALKSIIEYADISEEEKDLVAYGNACRLFGISPEDLELYDDHNCKLDAIALEADRGAPISVPVIDMHSHIIDNGACVNQSNMFGRDAESVLKKMNRMGVDTMITAPWIGICYDGVVSNEEILGMYRRYPERFLGYGCCNVNYVEDLEAVVQYHQQYPEVFVGIKPYPPYQKFSLLDPVCDAWYQYANEHCLMALIHADSPEYAEETDVLSVKYPDITFILAHSGTNYAIARKNAEVAKKHSNVVLDITYTTTGRGMVEFLVNEVGADKIVYGSDTPMRDPTAQMGWICYADISADDKKKILAGNIKGIMDKRK